MKNLIGGEKIDASDGAIIEVINPATNELIDTIPNSTLEDVNKVIQIAKTSQHHWAETSIYERGEILLNFLKIIENNKHDLAMLLCRETGKPIKEARNEIKNVELYVKNFVEQSRHDLGKLIPSGTNPKDEKTIKFTTREPLGVVLCIIPFNFPAFIFGQKVISALIMGNSVIVKPSTSSPLTVHKYCELLEESGIPSGVINCISGSGKTIGNYLSKSKSIDLITINGSSKVGSKIMENASKNLTDISLELGGNDAFIVDRDANINDVTLELVQGRLYNAGQVCCASKRFLIHKDIKNEFIENMISKVSTLKVGMPDKEDTDIGCLINEKAANKVREQVDKTVSQGAKILIGGRKKGAFYEPTIIDNVTKEMDIMKNMEVFGPVIPICTFETIDEAIQIANQSEYGLSSSIFTNNMKTAFEVATKLETGRVVINGASVDNTIDIPLSGWKKSGITKEGISSNLEEMSRNKTIVLKDILR